MSRKALPLKQGLEPDPDPDCQPSSRPDYAGITCSSARYSVGVKRPGRSAATFTRLSALYVSSVKYVRARSKLRDACRTPCLC